MKILKSWLQDHIVETLPSDEIIADVLTMKSSEVEGMEKVTVDGKSDCIFDIKTLPDRSHYMLSHRGVAYDLCAILGLALKPEVVGPTSDKIGGEVSAVKVKIETDKCNRYSAIQVKNVNNSESPEWLKARLSAIGARPISAIVDATNYAMFDTGQPLHAFDADKVVGGIIVRNAKEGEEIELLPERVLVDGKWEEKQRLLKLTADDMVIADDQGPLAIAGVKGGLRAVVGSDTKNIILESASFNPVAIRKTSTKYNVRNDSSKRFENEITAHLVPKGASVCLSLIEKIFPECVVGTMTDVYKNLPEKWSVKVSHKNIESVLNYSINTDRVTEILNSLGCKVSNNNGEYEITPPFERLDLVIEADIIDEIGRIQGLDKIKSILLEVKTNNSFSKEFLVTEKIKDFFYKKGFSEIQSRAFTDKGDIEVAYPMAKDKAFLRTSLLQGVSEAFKLAMNNAPLLGQKEIKIFEIGKTFSKNGEHLDLCFGISPVNKIKNREQAIKDMLDKVAAELGADLGVKIDAEAGYVKNIDMLDVNISKDDLIYYKTDKVDFTPFSNEPFMVRDIALFVSGNVESAEVESVIRSSISNTGGSLLIKGPDLFDQFEKEGKKSLAFRMIFQAMDRTLTDAEVNTIMEKVYVDVKGKGWEVR